MITWIKAYWKAHGTKILGAITAVGSFVTLVTDDIMHLVSDAYRPIAHMAIVAIGAAVVKRGFTNSANSTAP